MRLLKFILSCVYFAGQETRRLVYRLLGLNVAPCCVALYYHSISQADAERFAKQMELLCRVTTPLPADNRSPLAPNKRYSVITIDDGFRSTTENALPILVKNRIPVAVFVSPGLLETTPEWITFDDDELGNEQVVAADALRSWPKDLVTVGSHTLTHPWLPSSSDEDARAELSESRRRLSELLGRDVNLFSFPYGAWNEKLVRMCHDAGYARVFTSTPTVAFSDANEFVTGRLKANPSDWPLEFRLKALGAYRWLPKAFALKRLLFQPDQPATASNRAHEKSSVTRS